MNHFTVLKIMIDGTASFSYKTFDYPVSLTVVAGPEPHVLVEGHGDIREHRIPITGDLYILNGNGDQMSSTSYSELLSGPIPSRALEHRHVGINQNLGKTAAAGHNKLYAHQLMEGWGKETADHLSELMSFLVISHGTRLNCVVGVLDHNDENNLLCTSLRAVVYIPHEDNRVKQVIAVVKDDIGAVIGSLTTKNLDELNVGVDGSYFGHYGELKLYRLTASHDISFVAIPNPEVIK